MKHILAALYGLVFGIANVIPGVSGGTMLVVFGCYDKVCGALSLNFKEIKKNIVFLVFFGIGAVLGIVGFSFVVTFLFDNFPVPTNLFFMGLILGSVPLIIRNATVKEKFRAVCAVPFVIALAVVVGLTVLESNAKDPYTLSSSNDGNVTTITIFNDSDRTVDEWSVDMVDGMILNYKNGEVNGADIAVYHSTSEKIGMIFGKDVPNNFTQFVNQDGSVIEPHSAYSFTFENSAYSGSGEFEINTISYSMDVGFFLTMLLALLVAAIAMIIPGVSGSFVMMILGVYTTVIAAIRNFDFAVIIPCAIGAIIGIIFGARLISWLLKKYSLMVYSAILGLVIGSLVAIFPTSGDFSAVQIIAGVIAFVIGGVISYFVGKKTKIETAEE